MTIGGWFAKPERCSDAVISIDRVENGDPISEADRYCGGTHRAVLASIALLPCGQKATTCGLCETSSARSSYHHETMSNHKWATQMCQRRGTTPPIDLHAR